MRILNRYLFKTIFFSVLTVLLVLCALHFLGIVVEELKEISDSYTFLEILLYTSLNLPLSFYEFIPFAALVGALIGLGGLASTSELVVMRSAGVSLMQISLSVVRPIIVLIVMSLFLAEYVIPFTEQYAENRRSLKLNGVNTALSSRRGLWNREGDEYMHFNQVQTNGRLLGVTRYRFDENHVLLSSSFSASATYIDKYWQEEDVVETVFLPGGTEHRHYDQRSWYMDLSPELLTILVQESENLSISKLYNYIGYLKQQNINSGSFRLSFWAKTLQPLAVISLVLIAISFVFGPLREVTMGYRIFSGVVVGIIFQLAQELFGPASLLYGFPPFVAVMVPILTCCLIGYYLLTKNR